MPSQDKHHLNQIISAITAEAQARKAEILKQTEEQYRKELNQAENEVLQESFDLIKRKGSAIRLDAGHKISDEERAARRTVFARRESITGEVFAAAEEKLRTLAPEQYAQILAASAADISRRCGGHAVEITLRAQDSSYQDTIRTAFSGKVTFVQTDSIHLGGIKVKDLEDHLVYDDTLDSRLSAQRGWFMEHSGLTIQ